MAEFRLDLTATVRLWPGFAEENIAALGEGWKLAETMALLHGTALQRISRAAGRRPSPQDEAILLLGTHGLNLFLEFMSLIARGRFDVASHLMRAILDCQSLTFAVASNDQLATQFHDGNLKGVEGRKQVVEAIRPVKPELADFLDQRFKDESAAANELSHVNLSHVDNVLERHGDTITPIVGGRVDGDFARNMTGAALEHEHWQLTWFRAFKDGAVGADWNKDFDGIRDTFRAWMKEVFGATGYNADTDSST